MRAEPNLRIEGYRVLNEPEWVSPVGKNWGLFYIPVKSIHPVSDGVIRIISSGTPAADEPGAGWEHVSVSVQFRLGGTRIPTWEQMARVKDLFWHDDETVVQFHPRADRYVNVHPHCLHLWRRVGQEYELPPTELLA